MKRINVLAALLAAVLLVGVMPAMAADAAAFEVETVTAQAGDTVDVDIAVKNSPGVTSTKLRVAFDDALTLESVAYGTAVTGNFIKPQKMTSPVILNWANGLEDFSGNYLFATLTFAVAEDAQAGTYPITVTYDPDDVYNIEEENMDFAVVSGGVEISEKSDRNEAVCAVSDSLGNATTQYADLNEALKAAAALENGGTVTLLKDTEITDAFIPRGVTLDLGGYTLAADYLIGVRGSYLTATPNAGKLVIEKDCLLLSEQGYKNDAGQYVLPIWDPDQDCYLFSLFVVNTDTAKDRGLFIDKENEEIYFQFKHQATNALNKKLLADGASDNALEVIVRLTWVNDSGAAYQDFVYNDGFIAKATGSYDYTFTLTGYSTLNINLDTLTVTAMIVTDSGAVASGTEWTVENAK